MVDRVFSMKRIATAALVLLVVAVPLMVWSVTRTGALVTGNDLSACRSLAASERQDAQTLINVAVFDGLEAFARDDQVALDAAIEVGRVQRQRYLEASDFLSEAVVRSIADGDAFMKDCRRRAAAALKAGR